MMLPMTVPIVLLPPSEGKSAGGNGPVWTEGSFRVDLGRDRTTVAKALRSAMRQNVSARQKLLGVSGTALAQSTADDRAIFDAPTLPASQRYTGVLYTELDAQSLDQADRDRLDQMVLTVSGLWGLVAPTDPIPPYRLKMSASLGRPGKLSTWWRPRLATVLGGDGPVADQVRSAGVWNLLPQEHDAAIALPSDARSITVQFVDEVRDGAGEVSLRAVSHWNKLLKGALVRWLSAHPTCDVEALSEFGHPRGYVWDPDLGDATRAVLRRPIEAED